MTGARRTGQNLGKHDVVGAHIHTFSLGLCMK